jgi:formiminotetrahydrofolate cyclodeaminase
MDDNVVAFLKVLDSNDNTTGGGTAAAVAGAMAAALAAMVARLSSGKPGMEPDEYYAERADALSLLADELFDGGRQDSEAFASVRQAFRLPKNSDEEKAVRSQAIQAAWKNAAEIPLSNAQRCARVLALAGELEGRSNENAASDLACAFYLGQAGLKGCLENVAINLPMIKDEALVSQMEDQAAMLKESV